jgi:hypothetical protein
MILITQPRVGTSHNEILALQMAARELGWDVVSAPYGWRLDDNLTASGEVGVPYGSQTFCEVIAQQMNWKLEANSFDWLARLPEKYLKRKVEFMTLGEAKKITERKFIKPADDKCFDAKVYEPDTFHPHEIITNDYPVLVSEPVEFDLEYRCFCTPLRVSTWSNYIYHEHLANPKYWTSVDVLDKCLPDEFVQNLLDDLSFDDDAVETFPSVIDVGRIPGKGWAIIETNQAWASGLYGCDALSALKVMEQACGRIPQDTV